MLIQAFKKEIGSPQNAVLTVLLIVYILGFFIFSSTPGEKALLGNWFIFNVRITNIIHVPAFGILFFLMFRALRAWLPKSRKNCYLYAFVASSVYGIFLELYQAYVPGRCASFTDVLFNIIGVSFGIVAARFAIRI